MNLADILPIPPESQDFIYKNQEALREGFTLRDYINSNMEHPGYRATDHAYFFQSRSRQFSEIMEKVTPLIDFGLIADIGAVDEEGDLLEVYKLTNLGEKYLQHMNTANFP